jgi:hypothetical protein
MLKLGDPIAAVFTVAASSAGLRFSEPEIMLPTGTDLTAKTTYSTVRSIAENQGYRRAPMSILHRETLVSQSDFWSKSRNDILTNIDAPDYTLQEVGPDFDGAMRQQHVTAGVSFTF